MKKFCNVVLNVLFVSMVFVIPACSPGDDIKQIEKSIRSEVLRESSALASLEAVYILTFTHHQENLILSDDIYIQEDTVSMDYGFNIDDNMIKVVNDDGVKKLQVRLGKGDILATNRVTLHTPEVTHENYRPKDAEGKYIDIDEKINSQLEELKKQYGNRNIQYAKENIKNFFKIIAAKYNLELDFKADSGLSGL